MLFDAQADRQLATLSGHSGAVRSVAFSADSRLLASGDANGVVKIWNASAGLLIGSFKTASFRSPA